MKRWATRQLADPLFVRVCVAIYGVPMTVLPLLGILRFQPEQPGDWGIVALLLAVAAFGLFMSFAAFFGSSRWLERAAHGVADGGEWLGVLLLVAVALLALPTTAILRVFVNKAG